MNSIKDILTEDTFERFKYIENLVNKYPINEIDLTEINKIKDSFIEYKPKYDIISDFKIVNNLAIKLIHKKSWKEKIDELNNMKKYINIKDGNLEINILYTNDSDVNDKLINLIYSCIKVFKKINGDKKILAIIALCKMKRELTSDIIGRKNVNGGGDDMFGIKIYRKQEVIKVIFHELVHYYKLDHKEFDNYHVEIFKKFKIIHPEYFGEETNKSIHEVYTEYIAIKYHVAIISYYTKVSPQLIYHYEKIWSLYQTCKILHHYKISRFEDLYAKDFVEDTHVFSYYIIKFFLLWKNVNIKSYMDIKKILDDQEIINVINENIDIKFDKNLRMTLFELK
jgi:hypothetical protein